MIMTIPTKFLVNTKVYMNQKEQKYGNEPPNLHILHGVNNNIRSNKIWRPLIHIPPSNHVVHITSSQEMASEA